MCFSRNEERGRWLALCSTCSRPAAASSWGAASLRRALSEAPSSAALAAAGSSCSPAAPRCLRLLPRRRLRRSAPRRRRYRLLPSVAPLLSVPSEPSSLVAKGEGRGGQAAANENMRCAIHSCCAHAGRERADACGGRRPRGLAAGGGRARARAAEAAGACACGGVDSRRARASFFYFFKSVLCVIFFFEWFIIYMDLCQPVRRRMDT